MFFNPVPESFAVTFTTMLSLFVRLVPDISVGTVKLMFGLIVSFVNVTVVEFLFPDVSFAATSQVLLPSF